MLEAGLDREVWTHGEEIPIHVSVNNNSKKTVKSIRVSFEKKDDIKGRRWFEEINGLFFSVYNPTALRAVYGECPILLQGRTSNDKILSTFELIFIVF